MVLTTITNSCQRTQNEEKKCRGSYVLCLPTNFGVIPFKSLTNAPINVKPAGEWQGMGWGIDIFLKFAVKFPAHGQIIPVKCNQISPPRAAHCRQISQGWTQERHNKISPNKTLQSLFILRCCITKDTCSCYNCNYTF